MTEVVKRGKTKTLATNKTKKEPLVSVFVPYYNDKDFLSVCIDSILKQSYKNFELILLNHASTDGSDEIARSYKDRRIKHIDMENNLGAGSGVLMLEFLKLAKGKYIKLFCADDIMLPKCIKTLVTYLEKHPTTDFVFADMDYVDENEIPLNTKWSRERPGFNFKNKEIDTLKLLFKGIGHVPYVSVLIKGNVLREAHIDKSFVMLIDMSIWVSLLIKGKKLAFIDKTLVNYRIHDKQTASTKRKRTINAQSYYESMEYCDLFYEIKDLEMAKELCVNFPYKDMLTSRDTGLIPFMVALHYMTCGNPPYVVNGYMRMHKIMENDRMRERIEKKFGFGIKEFRHIYSLVQARRSFRNVRATKPYVVFLIKLIEILSLKAFRKKVKTHSYTE